jgi:CubicO group peptidase (beta-lactamase class C family)
MKLYKQILTFLLTGLLISVQAQDKSKNIDELVNKYHEYNQFTGSVLVAENGNVIYEKGIGLANFEWNIPNEPDTKFRLGSITKQFTSMLIMQLVEKGKIKLESNLSDYIPYYRKDQGDKITIHHLLTHTSGIPNYTNDPKFLQETSRDPYGVKEFIEKFCCGDLEFEPGTKWNYSNSGYFILGAIIEQVTGKTYETVLKENILEPIGMNSTGYDHNQEIISKRASGYNNIFGKIENAPYLDMSLPYSAGSLYSTVEDLYKWDQSLYTDKLLSNENKEIMFKPFFENYAYGWGVLEIQIGDIKKKIISHSGGINGFNTIIVRFVEDRNLIVLLCNVLPPNLGSLQKGISNILYNQPYEMPKRSLAEILAKDIESNGIEHAIKEFNALKENKKVYQVNENELNQLGYLLLGSNKIKEAIEVFKLNTEIFPESYNVWDSIGEAYMMSGDKENAIKYYKKSLKLNPDSQSGKDALKKLEAK